MRPRVKALTCIRCHARGKACFNFIASVLEGVMLVSGVDRRRLFRFFAAKWQIISRLAKEGDI